MIIYTLSWLESYILFLILLTVISKGHSFTHSFIMFVKANHKETTWSEAAEMCCTC